MMMKLPPKLGLAIAMGSLLYSPYNFAELSTNPTFVSLGYVGYRFTPNAFEPYFTNAYNNDEQEIMGGLFLNMNISIYDSFVVEGYADFATKFSAGVDKWSVGGGYVPFNNGIIATPITCGVTNYHATTDHDTNNYNKSESGPYCKARVSALIAPRWLADISAQYEHLDNAKQTISFENSFNLGLGFIPVFDRTNLIFAIDYSQRAAAEYTYRAGLKFDFS